MSIKNYGLIQNHPDKREKIPQARELDFLSQTVMHTHKENSLVLLPSPKASHPNGLTLGNSKSLLEQPCEDQEQTVHSSQSFICILTCLWALCSSGLVEMGLWWSDGSWDGSRRSWDRLLHRFSTPLIFSVCSFVNIQTIFFVTWHNRKYESNIWKSGVDLILLSLKSKNICCYILHIWDEAYVINIFKWIKEIFWHIKLTFVFFDTSKKKKK